MDQDKFEKFRTYYQVFRTDRNEAFALAAAQGVTKGPTETNAAFLLRLAVWFEGQGDKAGELTKVFDRARASGVTLLASCFTDWATYEPAMSSYLVKQGYSELTNVWLFTAPLDALNWKRWSNNGHQAVPLDSWRNILLLHADAKNAYLAFARLILSPQLDREPFPERDLDTVLQDLAQNKDLPKPVSLVNVALV